MRLSVFVFMVLFALITAVPAMANCLTEVEEFAQEICGELSKRGNQRIVEADGKLSANIGGIIKRFAGGFDVEGQAKIFEDTYENVLRSDLASELKDARGCRVKMVQIAREEVCVDPTPSDPCAEYEPMDADELTKLIEQGKKELGPAAELVLNAIEKGPFTAWVLDCGKVHGRYEQEMTYSKYVVSPSAPYQDRQDRECRKLIIDEIRDNQRSSTIDVHCRIEGFWEYIQQ